jgi:hypothetical protein
LLDERCILVWIVGEWGHFPPPNIVPSLVGWFGGSNVTTNASMNILSLLSENSQSPLAIYPEVALIQINMRCVSLDKPTLPNRPTVLVKVLINEDFLRAVDLVSWVFWVSLSHHVIQYDRLRANSKKKNAFKGK